MGVTSLVLARLRNLRGCNRGRYCPDGYEFSDVEEVINHSFVNPAGTLSRLEQGHLLPEDYRQTKLLRERASFSCAVDGI
jgi:hypothetical protein